MEKRKRDALEVTSIGTMYRGPWEKKYWSSSRGKDRYPYPVGYQAVRCYDGVVYQMEIQEGPRGPLFVVSCGEARSHADTPTIAWENAIKKGTYTAKKRQGRLFHSRVDGSELFGFLNPIVQRLFRKLVSSHVEDALKGEEDIVMPSGPVEVVKSEVITAWSSKSSPPVRNSRTSIVKGGNRCRTARGGAQDMSQKAVHSSELLGDYHNGSKGHEAPQDSSVRNLGQFFGRPISKTDGRKCLKLVKLVKNNAGATKKASDSGSLEIVPDSLEEHGVFPHMSDGLLSGVQRKSGEGKEQESTADLHDTTKSESKAPSLPACESATPYPEIQTIYNAESSHWLKSNDTTFGEKHELMNAVIPDSYDNICSTIKSASQQIQSISHASLGFGKLSAVDGQTCHGGREFGTANELGDNTLNVSSECHKITRIDTLSTDQPGMGLGDAAQNSYSSEGNTDKGEADSLGQELTKSMITLLLPQAVHLLRKKRRGSETALSRRACVNCAENDELLHKPPTLCKDETLVSTEICPKAPVCHQLPRSDARIIAGSQEVVPGSPEAHCEGDNENCLMASQISQEAIAPNSEENDDSFKLLLANAGGYNTNVQEALFESDDCSIKVPATSSNAEAMLISSEDCHMASICPAIVHKDAHMITVAQEHDAESIFISTEPTEPDAKDIHTRTICQEIDARSMHTTAASQELGASQEPDAKAIQITTQEGDAKTIHMTVASQGLDVEAVQMANTSCEELHMATPSQEHDAKAVHITLSQGLDASAIHSVTASKEFDAMAVDMATTCQKVAEHIYPENCGICNKTDFLDALSRSPGMHSVDLHANVCHTSGSPPFVDEEALVCGLSVPVGEGILPCQNPMTGAGESKSENHSDEINLPVGGMPENDMKEDYELNHLAASQFCSGSFEPTLCIEHPMPVLNMKVNVEDGHSHLLICCGLLSARLRDLFLYKLVGNELSLMITMKLEISDIIHNGIIEEHGMHFLSGGHGFALLGIFSIHETREKNKKTVLSRAVDDMDPYIIHLILFGKDEVLVHTKLKSDEHLFCLVLPMPNLIIAAGERGRVCGWTTDSEWRHTRESIALTVGNRERCKIIQLLFVPNVPQIIVGRDDMGSMFLWSLSNQQLLQTFQLSLTSVQEVHVLYASRASQTCFEDYFLKPPVSAKERYEGRNNASRSLFVGFLVNMEDTIDSSSGCSIAKRWSLVRIHHDGGTSNFDLDQMNHRVITALVKNNIGVAGMHNGHIYIWDTIRGCSNVCLQELEGVPITCVASDPEINIIVAANKDACVIVYKRRNVK